MYAAFIWVDQQNNTSIDKIKSIREFLKDRSLRTAKDIVESFLASNETYLLLPLTELKIPARLATDVSGFVYKYVVTDTNEGHVPDCMTPQGRIASLEALLEQYRSYLKEKNDEIASLAKLKSAANFLAGMALFATEDGNVQSWQAMEEFRAIVMKVVDYNGLVPMRPEVEVRISTPSWLET